MFRGPAWIGTITADPGITRIPISIPSISTLLEAGGSRGRECLSEENVVSDIIEIIVSPSALELASLEEGKVDWGGRLCSLEPRKYRAGELVLEERPVASHISARLSDSLRESACSLTLAESNVLDLLSGDSEATGVALAHLLDRFSEVGSWFLVLESAAGKPVEKVLSWDGCGIELLNTLLERGERPQLIVVSGGRGGRPESS